jgi:TldD protein
MALGLARRLGAGYVDLRIGCDEEEVIHARERRLERFNSTISAGFGIRVLLHGSWGFASSESIDEMEIERVVGLAIENAEANRLIQAVSIVLEDVPAYREDWVMPMRIDPFTIPADEKASRLLAINEAALRAGADYCSSTLRIAREEKLFASSLGSRIVQARVRCHPHFEVTAVDKQSGRFASRASLAAPRGSGWEYVDACDLASEAGVAADQAREKLKAKPVAPGRYDLVIDPTNLWLTLHETVGHSTELDRALGWEADYAGTSFLTPDKTGKFQFGSEVVNFFADRTQPQGLATVGYDDDGVPAQRWYLIRKGTFVDWQTTRDLAGLIGRKSSYGCSSADSWSSVPFPRMPNVSLEPAPAGVSLDDLIAEVKSGILIHGRGSYSIDQQRYNFQFGGQTFREIKQGKVGAMLRDLAYQSRTPDFWKACDGLGGEPTYVLGGTFNDGKGEPTQSNAVSHGCPPARFRQINVLNTAARGASS